MALDLDTAPGDQGVRKGAAKNGETVKVQLVTTGPVKDLVGVEFELKFQSRARPTNGTRLSKLENYLLL